MSSVGSWQHVSGCWRPGRRPKAAFRRQSFSRDERLAPLCIFLPRVSSVPGAASAASDIPQTRDGSLLLLDPTCAILWSQIPGTRPPFTSPPRASSFPLRNKWVGSRLGGTPGEIGPVSCHRDRGFSRVRHRLFHGRPPSPRHGPRPGRRVPDGMRPGQRGRLCVPQP